MIGKITQEILGQFISQFNKTENQIKLQYFVVDPIMNYISKKFYPYFISLTILLIINIILLTAIIYYLSKA